MIAIVSDIHSNLEALRAVLADIERQSADAIYCLGDVVGYGPNPRECLDLAQSFRVTVLGNHDQGALFDPLGFCGAAERAIFWTREQLETSPEPEEVRQRRWEFLASCPFRYREDDVLFVHGSARNPLNEYVFPEDVYHHRKIERLFALVERCCFQGHTHVPGVFGEEDGEQRFQFHSPAQIGHTYRLDGRKVLCNVGSVGQPRDGDPRSCYVLFDGETIRWRRVEYDIEATRSKIHSIPELDPELGDRLRGGR
jgi:diadenosine tetraphosphatase ApaH/serine/threonine PP2A family protein phosphatase